MSASDLEVHADDLRQICAVLHDARDTLADLRGELESTPDAGASSDEVARTMLSLAGALAGLGRHLGDLADTTASNALNFTGTDDGVAGGMHDRRAVLGP